jgi:hypothetical protein
VSFQARRCPHREAAPVRYPCSHHSLISERSTGPSGGGGAGTTSSATATPQ